VFFEIVRSDELILLLNLIGMSGIKRVNVSYPVLQQPLLTLDLGDFSVTDVTGRSEFEGNQKSILDGKESSSREIPYFGDYKDCLLSSGCLQFENHAQVRNELLAICSESDSGPRLLRPLFLGLDTNVAYFRFFSRHLPNMLAEERKIDDFKYVVSRVVREEIGSRVKSKFKNREISSLIKDFGHKELWRHLTNKSKKAARKAKMAQNELAMLRGPLRGLAAESKEYSKDKEERDRQISESYARFQEQNQSSVTMLTADIDMAYHARAARLGCIELRIPHKIPRHLKNEPWMLRHLLHDMAVTFGVIEMKEVGVTILGTWGGHELQDTEQENVKLLIHNKSSIIDELKKTLRICRKITNKPQP